MFIRSILLILFNTIYQICCLEPHTSMGINSSDKINKTEYILFCLTVSGMIIRFKAYQDLGNLYTFNIGIREDHKLVTTGIYKYIRHPGYTGGFLICIPLWLFTNVNIFITLVTIASTIYIYWNRIKYEELMLIEHFGTEYIQYSNSTKRLIPYVF